MFFDAEPKEFEPIGKEQLDAMLEVWEKDLFAGGRNESIFDEATSEAKPAA